MFTSSNWLSAATRKVKMVGAATPGAKKVRLAPVPDRVTVGPATCVIEAVAVPAVGAMVTIRPAEVVASAPALTSAVGAPITSSPLHAASTEVPRNAVAEALSPPTIVWRRENRSSAISFSVRRLVKLVSTSPSE